jgi:hypothetical protein
MKLNLLSINSGANPTIVYYNASAVNFYNATGSLARFESKNIVAYFEKRSSLLQRWRCSCKFKSRRIGSWPKLFHKIDARPLPPLQRSMDSLRPKSRRKTTFIKEGFNYQVVRKLFETCPKLVRNLSENCRNLFENCFNVF